MDLWNNFECNTENFSPKITVSKNNITRKASGQIVSGKQIQSAASLYLHAFQAYQYLLIKGKEGLKQLCLALIKCCGWDQNVVQKKKVDSSILDPDKNIEPPGRQDIDGGH